MMTPVAPRISFPVPVAARPDQNMTSRVMLAIYKLNDNATDMPPKVHRQIAGTMGRQAGRHRIHHFTRAGTAGTAGLPAGKSSGTPVIPTGSSTFAGT